MSLITFPVCVIGGKLPKHWRYDEIHCLTFPESYCFTLSQTKKQGTDAYTKDGPVSCHFKEIR